MEADRVDSALVSKVDQIWEVGGGVGVPDPGGTVDGSSANEGGPEG